MRWLFSFVFLALLAVAQALSFTGQRLLVVLEDEAEKDKYSQFWEDLDSRGIQLEFQSPKSGDLSLFKLGDRAYDHALLLPPKSKAYGPSLSPQLLLDFLSKGGNILLALSSNTATPTAITSLLLELDIHLPPDRNALVVDHFNYDKLSAADKHDVVLVPPPGKLRDDVRNFFEGENVVAVPRAVGQTLGNASPLLTPILRAPGTAYSYNPKDDEGSVEDLFASGEQLALVSALQARNSARFAVLGSAEMLQDEWFKAKVQGPDGQRVATGNKKFARQLTEWTFKEVGVLQVGRLQHHLNEGKKQHSPLNETSPDAPEANPKIYRIKNDATYAIELSEWDRDRLVPFQLPENDAVQLEFTMLSPFHRLPLTPVSYTANSTIYSTSFKLPDQHGIFNFRVNYKRPFLTSVDEKRQVTVRHFAHDEWPRSYAISGAYVWIAGIWATIIAWVGFVALWLWSEPSREMKNLKKTQ